MLRRFPVVIGFTVLFLWPCVRTQGDTIEISASIAAGFYEGGVHFPHHMNYFVGYAIPSSPIERRNYFVFAIPPLTDPIISAKLKLYLPGPPHLPAGYISSDPTEPYRISGSPFPVDGFVKAFLGDPSITPPMVAAMYGSLGESPPFGITTVSMDAVGMDVVIDFTPEGIAALNATGTAPIVIGGRLTALHPATPGIPPAELVFAYTDVGAHPAIIMPRLELTTIPEPSSPLLIAAMAFTACLLGVRGQQRCRR